MIISRVNTLLQQPPNINAQIHTPSTNATCVAAWNLPLFELLPGECGRTGESMVLNDVVLERCIGCWCELCVSSDDDVGGDLRDARVGYLRLPELAVAAVFRGRELFIYFQGVI